MSAVDLSNRYSTRSLIAYWLVLGLLPLGVYIIVSIHTKYWGFSLLHVLSWGLVVVIGGQMSVLRGTTLMWLARRRDMNWGSSRDEISLYRAHGVTILALFAVILLTLHFVKVGINGPIILTSLLIANLAFLPLMLRVVFRIPRKSETR